MVTAALVVLAVSAGGLYAWRMSRVQAHVEGLKVTGMEHLETGEPRRAMDALRGYLSQHPDDLEVLHALAKARMQVFDANGGHIRQAIAIHRRILELAPDDEVSKRELLTLYLRVGFDTEAAAVAEQLLKLHPDDPDALVTKARALWRKREYAQALEAAERYNELKPEDIEAQMLSLLLMQVLERSPSAIVARAADLAKAHEGDGRFIMLLGFANQMTGQRDAAITLYRRAAQNLPEDPQEVGRLAGLMDQVGLPVEATEVLRQAESTISDPVLARLLFRRLWEHGRLDLLTERADAFDFEDSQADTEAIAVLAMGLIQAQRGEDAAPMIEALKGRKKDRLAEVWVRVLQVIGAPTLDGQRLVDAAETALAHHPDHPYFHFLRGEGLVRTNRVEQAIEAWQTASRHSPSWPVPLLRIARAFLATDRSMMALQVAQGALMRASNNAEVAVTFLEAAAPNLDQLSDEQVQKVGVMVEEVIMQVPAVQGRLMPLVVDLHARRGEREQAAAFVRGALEADPAPPASLLLQLAAASHRHDLGLTRQCLEACERVGGVTPQFASVEAAWLAAEQTPAAALTRFRERAATADRSDADVARAWDLSATRLTDRLDPAAAIEAWRSLIKQYPEDQAVLTAAVGSPMIWADRDLAADAVVRLGRVGGENTNAWRLARARLLLASPSAGERELAEASSLLLDAAREAPYLVEPQVLLSRCFERLNNPNRALEYLGQAQRLAPRSSSIALDRARLLQALGDTLRAGEVVDELRTKHRLNAGQKMQLARLLAQRNDPAGVEELLQSTLTDEPDNRQAQLMLAHLYTRQGRTAEAGALYEELMTEPDATAIQAVASFHEAQGDVEAVRQTLARLDEVEIAADQEAMIRAGFAVRQGDMQQAASLLAAAAKAENPDRRVWQQLVALQLHRGKAAEALATAQQASKIYPGDATFTVLLQNREIVEAVISQPVLKELLMHMLTGADEAKAAAAALQMLVRSDRERRPMDEVATDLRRLAERHPRFLGLQNLLVHIYRSMGLPGEAADHAVRTMRAFPEATEPAWLAAEALAAAGRWNEALTIGQEFQKRARNQPLAADLLIAEAQLQLGRGEDAVAQLREHATDAASPQAKLLVLRTQVRGLVQEGDVDEAWRLLEPTLREGPEFRSLALQMAVLALPDAASAGRWLSGVAATTPADAAKERLALAQSMRALDERFGGDANTGRAVDLLADLSDEEGASAAAVQTLGMIHESEGRLTEAEAAYRRALTLDPKLPLCLNNLAMLLLNRDEASEALTLAEQAVAEAPRAPAFQDTLAMALIANGRAADAVATAKRAVSLEPQNLEWYLTLGDTFVAAELADEARKLLQWLDANVKDEAKLPERQRNRLESFRERVGVPASTEESADAPTSESTTSALVAP